MCQYFGRMWKDDSGAIVSIELILIVTIAVLSLVVGWSEVAHAVNTELDDISNAIGHMNQSYFYSGFSSFKLWGGVKSSFLGSGFVDLPDDCDNGCSGYSSITCAGPGVGVGFRPGVMGVHPGPAPIRSGVPCQTPDCIPDQAVPSCALTPIPDHGAQPPAGAPQSAPQGAPSSDAVPQL